MVNAGSRNFTSTWNAGSGRYEITIDDVSFNIASGIVLVTDISAPVQSLRASSNLGDVVVYPEGGTQTSFGFVVYRRLPAD